MPDAILLYVLEVPRCAFIGNSFRAADDIRRRSLARQRSPKLSSEDSAPIPTSAAERSTWNSEASTSCLRVVPDDSRTPSGFAMMNHPISSPGTGEPPVLTTELPAAAEGRRKRAKIGRACRNCRDRKTRCDGRRPVCVACERRRVSISCSYEEGRGPSRR